MIFLHRLFIACNLTPIRIAKIVAVIAHIIAWVIAYNKGGFEHSLIVIGGLICLELIVIVLCLLFSDLLN